MQRQRCQAGELAIVTRVPAPLSDLLGRVVLVEHPYNSRGKLAWWIDGGVSLVTSRDFKLSGQIVRAGERWLIDSLFDHWLTPLRGGVDLMAELRDMQRQGRAA